MNILYIYYRLYTIYIWWVLVDITEIVYVKMYLLTRVDCTRTIRAIISKN